MADFVPRLTDYGIQGNPYWYDDNPFYLAGYGLPNCTAYSWGRWWESGGQEYRPLLSTGNAEDWFGYNDGYERGSAPALGACLCLADGPYSGDGHVAIVEQINSDGSIVTSNSAYGGEYWYLQTLQAPNYLPAAGYVFQGFIYNPHTGGTPVGQGKKIWYFKKILWKNEKDILL